MKPHPRYQYKPEDLFLTVDEVLGADAARLALALDRPVYDCVYLALAYRISGQVVTADARLTNALAATEHGGSWGCWAVLCRSEMSDSIEAQSLV